MFNVVNLLIKPKTESLSNFVCVEEGCDKFADFFIKKIKTFIDQRSPTNISITESVLYKKTLDEFRTCGVKKYRLY